MATLGESEKMKRPLRPLYCLFLIHEDCLVVLSYELDEVVERGELQRFTGEGEGSIEARSQDGREGGSLQPDYVHSEVMHTTELHEKPVGDRPHHS